MIEQVLSSIDCHIQSGMNGVDTTVWVNCKINSVEQLVNKAIRLNGTDGAERAKVFIFTIMIHN